MILNVNEGRCNTSDHLFPVNSLIIHAPSMFLLRSYSYQGGRY